MLGTASAEDQRIYRQPPEQTILRPWESRGRIIIKFAEGTEVRLRNGDFRSLRGHDLNGLKHVLARHGVQRASIRPLIDRPELELAEERRLGELRSGRTLADLSLYYTMALRPNTDSAAICDALNALGIIESASPEPALGPPPSVDIPPVTPDFSDVQGYRALATGGIGIDEAAAVTGVDGAGTTFVDIEFGWHLDHEDLGLSASTIIDSATIDNPYDPSHGTAVLGMLVGIPNNYGITGMVPAATAMAAPIRTLEHGGNLPRAISHAIAALSAGDVILLESQAWVCDGIGAFGPVEWNQPSFDAIQTATALGIIVVETAGNGYGNGALNLGVNLDSPDCDGLFNRSVRDSGAIIVGAAEAVTRNKAGYSTYGSRVDVQGWGDQNVVTTGFGDLFEPDPADILQAYTANFSGTSSAAPMVVAAILAIQGARQAAGEAPLDPSAMRTLLTSTGLPQGTGGNIGPLPNMLAALEETLGISLPEIDIDPWNDPNEIDPESTALITVGVKTTSVAAGEPLDFDATQIDPASLAFGPANALNQAIPIISDIDGDSDLDAVFAFGTQDTGIVCEDESAQLTGETYGGESIIATDSIVTTGCDDASCHP